MVASTFVTGSWSRETWEELVKSVPGRMVSWVPSREGGSMSTSLYRPEMWVASFRLQIFRQDRASVFRSTKYRLMVGLEASAMTKPYRPLSFWMQVMDRVRRLEKVLPMFPKVPVERE